MTDTLRERIGRSFRCVVDTETRVQILNCVMPVVEELIAGQREKDAETVRRFALAGHAQDAEWAIRSQQEKPE